MADEGPLDTKYKQAVRMVNVNNRHNSFRKFDPDLSSFLSTIVPSLSSENVPRRDNPLWADQSEELFANSIRLAID
jgi:hypothetical protein